MALLSGNLPSMEITFPIPKRWCSTSIPTIIIAGSSAIKSVLSCAGFACVAFLNPCGTVPLLVTFVLLEVALVVFELVPVACQYQVTSVTVLDPTLKVIELQPGLVAVVGLGGADGMDTAWLSLGLTKDARVIYEISDADWKERLEYLTAEEVLEDIRAL